MAIVKMRRLRLIALCSQRDAILASLLRAGCVHITEPRDKLEDPEWTALLSKESSQLSAMRGKAAGVENAMQTLRSYARLKGGLFAVRPEITEAEFLCEKAFEHAMAVTEHINANTRRIAQLHAKQNRLISSRRGFEPWISMDYPVEKDSLGAVRLIRGALPAAVSPEEVSALLAEKAPLAELRTVSQSKEQTFLLLLVHESMAEVALQALRPFAFSVSAFKGYRGTPSENISSLQAEIDAAEEERNVLADEIISYASEMPALRMCADRLKQEIAKQAVRENFLSDSTVFFAEGWVPVPDIERLENALQEYTCAIELTEPTEEDTPPTELRNSKLIHSMQMVTEMYSLPAYRGIDPNPLIFPFFSIFFGMMYADVAYGLILIVLSQIVIRKFRPKGTFGNIMQLATICGVTAAFWGALTGGIFGDAYTVIAENFFGVENARLYVPVLDPLSNPMQVLYLAIIMGAIQLIIGQLIHIWMGFRDKNGLDALLDVVPWWILFAGIAVMVFSGSSVGLIAGVAALVLTQGRHKKGILGKLMGGVVSLYDVTTWLGDILSYTRLMALMLASTVIASVVNILGTLPGNAVLFGIIFVIGHGFNMGINIIGTYVHAARLQYLEYFGKFYVDGGIPFMPLRYDTKHVDIITREG